ncbi:hypothetical protein [Bernardetia sp.]|uniref:hypothetical protein n=1 Tax=Bernardetia sp. TaxID=1937974 RepID=UPI0025BB9CF1|nr:hypothetical protein [Bernardetia sp.]
MRRIKLYLMNPILPTLCLLVSLCWIGYDSFIKEKYTEEEKEVWESATNEVKVLGNYYLENTYYLSRDLKDFSSYEYCLDAENIPLVALELMKVIKKLANENFVLRDDSKSKEIPVRFVFESYVKKASELDTVLAKKYADFEFEKDLSDAEINEKYFSHDNMQNKYHLARFELQLVAMYHNDIELLIDKYFLDELKNKLSNPVVVPYITNEIERVRVYNAYPFDTLHTKIESPTGVETHFDKNGFLIIPPSLREKNIDMDIRINCSSDTTYHYKNYYEE